MKEILDDMKYYRMALGINMIFNAFPLITFVRDGLNLGPRGSIFPLIYWSVGLLLLTPINVFKRIYAPNAILTFLLFAFMAHCLIYMHYKPDLYFKLDKAREYAGILIPSAFLFGLMYYPNDKVDKILPVMIVYTLLGSLGLLYYILTDPNWDLGQRAAIRFAADPEAAGNPHTFANNAILCFLACLIYSNQTRSSIIKITCYLLAIFSFVIVVLCRTNTSLMVLALIIVANIMFRGKQILKSAMNKTTALFMVFLFIVTTRFILQNAAIKGLIEGYYAGISSRIVNTIFTASGASVSKSQIVDIDESAVYRVYSYRYVKKLFTDGEWADLIVGQGYQAQSLDIPSLEALTNQGIVGFLLYNSFIILLGFFTLLQIIRPSNGLSSLIANFCILLLLSSLTGGRPTKTDTWITYMFVIRFLGIYYQQNEAPTAKLQIQSQQLVV